MKTRELKKENNLQENKINLQSGRLISKLVEDYEKKHGVNVLRKRRDRELVVPRQCLGLILNKKFRFTLHRTGRLLNCNHATIINGNNKVMFGIEAMYSDYIDAMLNWKLIFDENGLHFDESDSTDFKKVDSRIKEILYHSLEYKILSQEEIERMLKSMVEAFSTESLFGNI